MANGNVTATFGDIKYRENGVIGVPVTFGEAVIANAKTIFRITHVSGDPLQGIDYRLVGKNTAYALVFAVPPDRSGRFQITAKGEVLLATGSWDNVVASALDVDYDTSIPRLKDYDIPADYTAGEIFDVILQFDTEVTFNDAATHFGDMNATWRDFFVFEGAQIGGPPNLYRKTNNTYPTLPLAEDLGTDWTQADLTTEEATIYLLRWDSVQSGAEGIFNLTLKPNAVRGPVS